MQAPPKCPDCGATLRTRTVSAARLPCLAECKREIVLPCHVCAAKPPRPKEPRP